MVERGIGLFFKKKFGRKASHPRVPVCAYIIIIIQYIICIYHPSCQPTPSTEQVLRGQQLQVLPRGDHAVCRPGRRAAGRHAVRVVPVRARRVRVRDDSALAEREQQRHD